MIFKKKKKSSFINEDELSDASLESKQSFLSKIFKKKEVVEDKKETSSNSNSMIDTDVGETNTDNGMVEVNTGAGNSLSDMYSSGGSMIDSDVLEVPSKNDDMEMIEGPINNKKIDSTSAPKVKKKTSFRDSKLGSILNMVFDVLFVAVLVFLFLRYSPKIITIWGDGRVKYAKMATEMATNIKNYYEQDGQKCTTTTPKKYYFNLYDSTERFGEEYKSPVLKRVIKGYVEIEDNGRDKEYYVYFTDGFMGIKGVKLEDINAKSVGLFTSITLDHPKAMECKIKFEIPE